MTATAALLAAAEEGHTELPIEPWAFGVGVFALLVVLLLVTLSFGKDR